MSEWYSAYRLDTGEITSQMVSEPEHLAANVREGHSALLGRWSEMEGWVQAHQFTPYTAAQAASKADRPGLGYLWSNSTMQWEKA